ncbi:MAG: AAA family ATPase [Gemmatimonadetes bacterium]|nr:AAA family ATPase [Gemmatimonadota bacterium]
MRERERAAERRQLTVMFCDLVGSTALAGRLDPEELRELLRSYHLACSEVTARYGGYIAQYLGDGVLVYFGYPDAHEDDARRAVYAGLEIMDAVRRLAHGAGREISLAARAGIHTGPVVAGEVGAGAGRQQLALGLTPNIAARLQALAEPYGVLISRATDGLVQGFFECESLGRRELKGIEERVEVLRVARALDVRSTFESAVARGLSHAVGRVRELEALVSAYESVARGEGRVALVSGEAGIGKSRLVLMLRERLAPGEQAWLVAPCSPYDQTSAWSPIVELLHKFFQFRREDGGPERLVRIEGALRPLDLPTQRAVPLFASLLGVPYTGRYPELELGPQKQRELTIETLIATLLRLTEARPLVLTVEDLHWSDPSSLELLDRLVERVSEARLLLILTFRPSFSSAWNGAGHILRLPLERLAEEEAAVLVTDVTGGRRLPPELVRRVLAHADGVPLFIEELTRSLLESGVLEESDQGYELTSALSSLAIPATLNDSLMARLDRLGPAREIAQLAAVIGREFGRGLLAAVAEVESAALEPKLEELVESGLVQRRRSGGEELFAFKHALVREAAYATLLRRTRQEYHRRVAGVLAADPAIAEMRPELLALHLAEAQLPEPAIRAWLKAAELAMSRWASTEAIEHLTRGLKVLAALPEGAERNRLELELQSALGRALTSARGYAAPEVERTYARALELCERMGDSVQLFWMLWGLGGYYMVRGDLMRPIRKQMLRLAQTLGDPSIAVEGHFANGIIEFYLGGLAVACRDLDRAVELDTPGRSEARNLVIGVDGGITAASFGAMANWLAGRAARAAALAEECEALAHRLRHTYSYAFALTHIAFLHLMRRHLSAAMTRAAEALSIAEEKGFLVFKPMCGLVLGWAATHEAEAPERGLTIMRHSLDGWREAGALIWQTYFLAHLADRHTALGGLDEADALLQEALEAAHRTHERFWEPELHRLKGNVGLARGDDETAEAAYRRALEVADSQGARALALRAARALARLLRDTGRETEARASLQAALAALEDAASSPDVAEAMELLQVMA